jgi:hypothetical protein
VLLSLRAASGSLTVRAITPPLMAAAITARAHDKLARSLLLLGASTWSVRVPRTMLGNMRVLGLGLVLVLCAAGDAFAQAKLAQLTPAPSSAAGSSGLQASPPQPNPPPAVPPSVNDSAYKKPTVVVVMESSGGLRAATALRKALNQAGCSVVSLIEAQRKAMTPDVLLTIGADNSRIQVVYWDSDGRPDLLSAIGPSTQDQVDAVVLALSSALIERHRTIATIPREVMARARMFDDQRATRAIYAMLGRGTLAPRTNVYLRFEDF